MVLGVNESDGFALAMIAILGISFSFVLVILVGIIRQTRKANSENDELIEEVRREEETQPAGGSSDEKESEPWEKQADWWKRNS